LEFLSEKDQKFIKLVYGIDNEQRDDQSIAKILGISRQAISEKKLRIIKKLQKICLS
jgi:DNA-directed RNA polymerase specialized sigma subunit